MSRRREGEKNTGIWFGQVRAWKASGRKGRRCETERSALKLAEG